MRSPTELISNWKPLEPDALEDRDDHLDHFGVDHGRLRPDGLRADLKELAIAALLRALAAEHRAHVVELLNAGPLVQAVLDVGADHRRGVSGRSVSERAVTIVEGVHLFRDDVRFLADPAREQLRLLEDRRPDFVVVVGFEDTSRGCLHLVPDSAGGRKDIARAFDRFDHLFVSIYAGSSR